MVEVRVEFGLGGRPSAPLPTALLERHTDLEIIVVVHPIAEQRVPLRPFPSQHRPPPSLGSGGGSVRRADLRDGDGSELRFEFTEVVHRWGGSGGGVNVGRGEAEQRDEKVHKIVRDGACGQEDEDFGTGVPLVPHLLLVVHGGGRRAYAPVLPRLAPHPFPPLLPQ